MFWMSLGISIVRGDGAGRAPGAGLRLDEGLMRGLEGRSESVAGTVNAQEVANMLWAYATTGRA